MPTTRQKTDGSTPCADNAGPNITQAQQQERLLAKLTAPEPELRIIKSSMIPDCQILRDSAVRRDIEGNRWIAPDAARTFFETCFGAGLMRNVKLHGKALPMKCRKHESRGEAIAEVTLTVTEDDAELEMPDEVTYVAEAKYSPDLSKFIIKVREPRQAVVTSCDFLLLRRDGTSQYGWIRRPVGLPLHTVTPLR